MGAVKKKDQDYSAVKSWLLVFCTLKIVCNFALMVILVWLRLDWGVTDWAHHAYFSNYWSGIYIFFAGCCLGALDSIIGFCAIINASNSTLIVDQVAGMTSVLLQLIGLTCILTDAIGKPVKFIEDLLLGLIDPTLTNNIVANEHFLDNMYRIVECCGAHGSNDYLMYDRTPPNACINRYHAGGIYYESGCGAAFSDYLRDWSAGLGAVVFVSLIIQIISCFLACSMMKHMKTSKRRNKGEDQELHLLEDYARKPLPAEPVEDRIQPRTERSKIYDTPTQENTAGLVHNSVPIQSVDTGIPQQTISQRMDSLPNADRFKNSRSQENLRASPEFMNLPTDGPSNVYNVNSGIQDVRNLSYRPPVHPKQADLLINRSFSSSNSNLQGFNNNNENFTGSNNYLNTKSSNSDSSYNGGGRYASPANSNYINSSGSQADTAGGYPDSLDHNPAYASRNYRNPSNSQAVTAEVYPDSLNYNLGYPTKNYKNSPHNQAVAAEVYPDSLQYNLGYPGMAKDNSQLSGYPMNDDDTLTLTESEFSVDSRDLRPQIGVSERQRPIQNGYQSEIRNLIQSYQTPRDQRDNRSDNSSVYDNGSNNVDTYSTDGNHYTSFNSKKNVSFTSDRAPPPLAPKPRLKGEASSRLGVERNKSFKTAVRENNVHISSNIIRELSRSMESLHDGFKSLSRVNSTGSLQRSGRSRSGSIRSTSSTGSYSREKSRSQDLLSSRSPSADRRSSNPRIRPEIRSKSMNSINILAKGLRPRNKPKKKRRQGRHGPSEDDLPEGRAGEDDLSRSRTEERNKRRNSTDEILIIDNSRRKTIESGIESDDNYRMESDRWHRGQPVRSNQRQTYWKTEQFDL